MFSSIITFPDFIVEKGSVIDRRSCKGFLHETGHASTEKHQFLFEWWINIVWQGKEIEATTSPQQHSDKLLCGKLACLHSFLWNDKTKSWICRAVPGLWLMLSCGQVKSPHSLCRLRGEEKQGPPFISKRGVCGSTSRDRPRQRQRLSRLTWPALASVIPLEEAPLRMQQRGYSSTVPLPI